MAFEPTPAVVYSPEPDLGAVLDVLRSTPGLLDLRADGPDDDWREIRLTIDDPNAVRRVLVRNDPSHWQRPGFDTQLAGMQQFLARNGVDARTGPMIESLSELGFAISLSGDDGQRHPYLHDDDPAGRMLVQLLMAKLAGQPVAPVVTPAVAASLVKYSRAMPPTERGSPMSKALRPPLVMPPR